jgi:hypothetical protein
MPCVLAHIAFPVFVGNNEPKLTLLSTLAAYADKAGYCQARFARAGRKPARYQCLTDSGTKAGPMPQPLGWIVPSGCGTRRCGRRLESAALYLGSPFEEA